MRSEAERAETKKRLGRMRKDSTLKLIARRKEPRLERRDKMRKDSRLKRATKRKETRLTNA